MLGEYAKLVEFIHLAGEVSGRKKLQKMVYIAKKMKMPFHEKYEFHIYGPYSEELTLRVEELCEMGFISERLEDKGSYVKYTYACTNEGQQFLTSMNSSQANLTVCVDQLNGKSSRFLELVSTLLYFDHLSREQQIEKIHVVKGKLNFSDEEITQAFDFMNELEMCLN